MARTVVQRQKKDGYLICNYVFKILHSDGDDGAQKSQNYKQQFKEKKKDGMCIKNIVYMYEND